MVSALEIAAAIVPVDNSVRQLLLPTAQLTSSGRAITVPINVFDEPEHERLLATVSALDERTFAHA